MTRRLMLAVAVLLAVGIFVTCTIPTEIKHSLHTQGSLHPWIHIAAFALLACLAISGLRSNLGRLVVVAALLIFGYVTEARESQWDHWPIERRDVRSDAAGVATGTVLGLALASLGKDHDEKALTEDDASESVSTAG